MNNFLCLPLAGSAPNAPPAGTSGKSDSASADAKAGFAGALAGVMGDERAPETQPEDTESAGLLAAMQAQSAWLLGQLSPQQIEIVQGAGDALTMSELPSTGGDQTTPSQIQQAGIPQVAAEQLAALLSATDAAQNTQALSVEGQQDAVKTDVAAAPAEVIIKLPDELAGGQISLPPELLGKSTSEADIPQLDQAGASAKGQASVGAAQGQVQVANTLAETPLDSAATTRQAEPVPPPNAGPPATGDPATVVSEIEAEPDRLAEAHHAEILEQISSSMERLGRSGGSSLRIQLHPEHLGRIDLRLAQRAEGLHVNLIAEQAGTGALIERHAIELQQSLLEAGVNLAGLSIGHGNAERGRGQGNQPGSRRSYPANPAGEKSERSVDSLDSRERVWNSNAQVDYRI